MSTETYQLTINGLLVDVIRKDIKNLHLGVYPPEGHVRVAAPLLVSNDAVRLAAISRLAWIKRQQARFETQPRQSAREMVGGESHYFLGRRYRLRVIAATGRSFVRFRGKSYIKLQVAADSTTAQRERLLQHWYRQQLRELIPALIEKWQAALGVEVADLGIKRMKTKWGSCSIAPRRVWFNLELAKKPLECLEYVVAHELVHLLERHHNDRFIAIMNQYLPRWRHIRELLNSTPLAHESWKH